MYNLRRSFSLYYSFGQNHFLFSVNQLRTSIRLALFLALTTLNLNAQNSSEMLKWHDIDSKANRTLIYTSAADNNAVYYTKNVGLLKPKEFKVIKSDYNFKNKAEIDLLASGKNARVSSRLSVLDANDGKTLGMESTSGFVKGQFPISLKYGLLDANLKMVSSPKILKMAPDAMIPVNMMDMTDIINNRYIMSLKYNDQFVICYLHCSDQEGNLQVGIGRFDADYNLVSNELIEIPIQANRIMDARLTADANFDSYYILLKETSAKNPRKRFELNDGLGGSRNIISNEEKVGLSTIYRIQNGKTSNSFAITDYKSQTTDMKALSDGNILVVGLERGEKGNKFYGFYNYIFDSELKEITSSKLPFTDMMTADMQRFTEKDKALKLKIRHLKLIKLGSNYVSHIELSGYTEYISNQGTSNQRSTFLIISYNDVFTQINEQGKFTGQTSMVVKEQREGGPNQRYTGSIIYEHDNKIHVLFNDTPENLKSGSKVERWEPQKMKKEETIVRRIIIDEDMKTVSKDVISPKGAIAIMPSSSWSDSERTVVFATDTETTYGTVIVH